MNKVIDYITARAQERSTWLGILGVLGTFGVHLAPDLTNAIVSAAVGVAGVVLAITKDHKPT